MSTKRTKKTLVSAGVGIAVIAVVGVGLLGYNAAAATNNPNEYRTVTAAAGTVTQVLSLSGTVHHVTQASVSFPTSGTVTGVNVKAGDTVTAGEALASINATPLQNAVLADNATYTAAIAQYQTDQQTLASSSTTTSSTTKVATSAASTSHPATASTSSTPSSSASPSGTATPSGGSTGATTTTDPTAAVKAATDAIAALQTGIETVESTLPTFIAQCVPLIPTTAASPQATVTKTVTATATVTQTVTDTVTVKAAAANSGATGTTAAAGTSTATTAPASTTRKPSASATAAAKANAVSTATPTASTPVTAACQGAINTLTASNATLPDQMTAANVALTAAVSALDAQAASLDKQAATLAKAGQTTQSAAASSGAAAARSTSSTLSSTNSALQAAAAAGLSRSGTGGTVTSATLITDQSAIAAADIALVEAQDQLTQATITSPIAGKVASMPFVVGQQASATATAVVIGTGAIEITDAVPLASRPLVATGEPASVTSVVGGSTLQGTISRISLLPTTTGFSLAAAAAGSAAGGSSSSTNTSTTTYATVITVATGGDLLPEGSRVQTIITTKTVNAAVVVPTSAVTPISTGSGTVEVVTNGVVSTKRVVTGPVDETDIQIVSGINAGDTVVIADTTKPIPGASITASRASQSAQAFPNGGGNFTAGGAGGAAGGGAAPAGAPAS
jgi:multidrug efflux pump subunit AcrA (membrane-fusion protein)